MFATASHLALQGRPRGGAELDVVEEEDLKTTGIVVPGLCEEVERCKWSDYKLSERQTCARTSSRAIRGRQREVRRARRWVQRAASRTSGRAGCVLRAGVATVVYGSAVARRCVQRRRGRRVA